MAKYVAVVSVVLIGVWCFAVTAAAQEAEVAADAIRVTVTDPGEAPRKPLRYKLPMGAGESFTMDMKMRMRMTIGEHQQDMQMPTMRFVSSVEVVEQLDEGARVVTHFVDVQVLEDGNVPDIARQQMKAMLGGMKGLTLTCVVKPNGAIEEMKVDGDNDLDPQLRQQLQQVEQSMAQLSVPLPEEAVGKGAIWHVDQTVDTGPMPIRQRVTTTLKEINGDDITLSMSVDQNVNPQLIEQNGQKIDLRSFEGSGEGEFDVSLDQLAPRGTVTSKNTMEMVTQGQEMQVFTDMKLEVKDAEAAAAAE